MPYFNYRAINEQGVLVRGLIEHIDIDHAYDNISDSGLHIVKIYKSDRVTGLYLKKVSSWSIKPKDIIEFAKNLSVMQRAGLPLIQSITDMAESSENRHFRDKLLSIKRSIELGSGFSEALARHKDVFPEIFINLMSVGEETGRLSESLTDVALHLERMEDLKSAIVRALMYPAFALIGTMGALMFWLIYVLPKMSELFKSMGVSLPPLTQALIAASDIASSRWYIFFLAPVMVYAILKLLSRYDATRYYLDAAKLRLPVINLVTTNKLLALFAEQLRILIAAGVTIDRALDMIINVINNSVYRKAVAEVKNDIVLGSNISDAIRKHPALFPNLVIRMISIGESTGNLTEQLNYLSEYFLKKLDDISQKMGKMIEPIIIIVIGGMFVVIIMGLLAPIYDIVSGIGS
ncbi:MAG: type II secretion system F family protein [Nitrospiraceae bacterium]|nr:MAG: type II secretion system F family protein [Nitrospiraceae bacterium]